MLAYASLRAYCLASLITLFNWSSSRRPAAVLHLHMQPSLCRTSARMLHCHCLSHSSVCLWPAAWHQLRGEEEAAVFRSGGAWHIIPSLCHMTLSRLHFPPYVLVPPSSLMLHRWQFVPTLLSLPAKIPCTPVVLTSSGCRHANAAVRTLIATHMPLLYLSTTPFSKFLLATPMHLFDAAVAHMHPSPSSLMSIPGYAPWTFLHSYFQLLDFFFSFVTCILLMRTGWRPHRRGVQWHPG